jgi:hypothetical protein
MHEPTETYGAAAVELALLDAAWRRCRREAHRLMLIELALTVVGVGVLVVVALCGIVAITHTAVVAGALGLPLGLALAVTLALMILGLAARARMSHELVAHDLFRCECARRGAAERARGAAVAHPYRAPPSSSSPSSCTSCQLYEPVLRARWAP